MGLSSFFIVCGKCVEKTASLICLLILIVLVLVLHLVFLFLFLFVFQWKPTFLLQNMPLSFCVCVFSCLCPLLHKSRNGVWLQLRSPPTKGLNHRMKRLNGQDSQINPTRSWPKRDRDNFNMKDTRIPAMPTTDTIIPPSLPQNSPDEHLQVAKWNLWKVAALRAWTFASGTVLIAHRPTSPQPSPPYPTASFLTDPPGCRFLLAFFV